MLRIRSTRSLPQSAPIVKHHNEERAAMTQCNGLNHTYCEKQSTVNPHAIADALHPAADIIAEDGLLALEQHAVVLDRERVAIVAVRRVPLEKHVGLGGMGSGEFDYIGSLASSQRVKRDDEPPAVKKILLMFVQIAVGMLIPRAVADGIRRLQREESTQLCTLVSTKAREEDGMGA